MEGLLDRLADKIIAKLTPLLEDLVKKAVDEANADLVTDVSTIPQKIGALIEAIPGVGPLTDLLKGL